jgi:hypothetical protein
MKIHQAEKTLSHFSGRGAKRGDGFIRSGAAWLLQKFSPSSTAVGDHSKQNR